MFCTNCGKALPKDSMVCGYCGEKLQIDDLIDNVKEEDSIAQATSKKGKTYIHQSVLLPAGVQVINKRNQPLKTFSFFVSEVLLLIPILNIVLLFIWAFHSSVNDNRKFFARSILIWLLLIVICVSGFLTYFSIWGYLFDTQYILNQLKAFVNNI